MNNNRSENMGFGILDYLKQSLIHPAKTGSIAPSSKRLVDMVMDLSNLQNSSSVIELGSGSGVFTEKILKEINPDTVFFAVEINPEFVEATRKRCPDVVVYNDSAENAKELLSRHGLSTCDCIISTLPWSVLSSAMQDKLLTTIWDILRPGGSFLTVSYSHVVFLPSAQRFKNKLYDTFSSVYRSETVWTNFPPAFIYSAEK